MTKAQYPWWLVTAVIAGAVGMALEVVGFRLYAPYFGYSIYVWGSMISVIMLALAAGYGVGGRLADRSKTGRPLYGLILGAAFYQLIVVFAARPLLGAVSTWGDFGGTTAATLIVFAPPMAALAVVGPFVVRLLARAGHVGSIAGMVYAVSTAGSMAGVLGASFYLLPHYGTQATLKILCLATALVGVAGLVGRQRAVLAGLAPFVLLWAAPAVAWPGGTIWTAESAYNLIRVMRQGTRLELLLNSRDSIHTLRDESSTFTGFYYDDFALGPLLTPTRRVLVLGMGGGGSVRATRITAPGAFIDAVEIDAKVVEAADRFFGVRADGHLRINVADARPWLARRRAVYDLVHVDLYQGGPYIPFYLSTVEFFSQVRAHTSDDGILLMNVFDPSEHGIVLSPLIATIRRSYPSVMVLPAGLAGNHMVFAFASAQTLASVRQKLAAMEGQDVWHALARKSAQEITEPILPPDAIVFTDDHAPIEALTRRMLRE